MPRLTDEQKTELAKLSPEDIIKKLDAQHEITDRYQARAEGAEGKLTAAEKKAAKDAEDARLKDASEVERAKAEAAAAKKEADDAKAEAARVTVDSAIRVAALANGAKADDLDDIVLLVRARNAELDGKSAGAAVATLKEQKKTLFPGTGARYEEGDDHADTGAGSRHRDAAKEKSRAEYEKLSSAEQMEFFKKGGRIKG